MLKLACRLALASGTITAAMMALTTNAGCASRQIEVAPAHALEMSSAEVRRFPMYTDDGRALGWDEFMDAAAEADVIIVGEQHNDGAGHRFQQEVVAAVCSRWPGSALSMEMLERDEQPLVDDYFDEIIDAKQLASLTHSENWGGKGGWVAWYQPIVDAARDANGRVIAANAPRRYTRLARTDGFERLESLPLPRREWVSFPDTIPEGAYRDRFFETMRAQAETPGHGAGPATGMDDEKLESFFRGQLVWDATMASSIAEGLSNGANKVVHLVGQFHSDFEGGTVQQLGARRPSLRVLVISMQPGTSGGLREEDRGRADVVVYTGG